MLRNPRKILERRQFWLLENYDLVSAKTSWLPSKKESNTWGAIFPNPYSHEYKMTGNKR